MGILQSVLLALGTVAIILILALRINPVNELRRRILRFKSKREQKRNKRNELKLKSLSQCLIHEGEIDLYIEYNRHNLPDEAEWDELLVSMIHELLSVGWNIDMPIGTRITYGAYRIDSRTGDIEISKKVYDIFSKYIEIYETGSYED